MLEIKGKVNTAICYASVIEEGERILAVELEKLLRDEEKLQDLRRRAAERSKYFSTEKYLQRLCKLIEDV